MVSANSLVYDFDREFARFNTAASKNLRLLDKIRIINKAQDIYVEGKAQLAEVDSKVRAELRDIEEKDIELSLVEEGDKFNIYRIPEGVLKFLRQSIDATKEGCGEKKYIPVTIFRTNDLGRARSDLNWKSSFAWETVIGDEGRKGLYIWHEGDFGIDRVYVDYIRKPNEIHAPELKLPNKSYKDWNGVQRAENQDCELSSAYQAKDLIDIAVLVAQSTVTDVSNFQTKVNEIINTRQTASF